MYSACANVPTINVDANQGRPRPADHRQPEPEPPRAVVVDKSGVGRHRGRCIDTRVLPSDVNWLPRRARAGPKDRSDEYPMIMLLTTEYRVYSVFGITFWITKWSLSEKGFLGGGGGGYYIKSVFQNNSHTVF